MSLTGKQRRFVDEYLKCFNATQAALRAGYSEKTAYSIGHENLNKPEIKAELSRIYRENVMPPEEVLHHLTEIARGDIDAIIDRFGNLDIDKARELGRSNLIKSVKQRTITGEDSDIHEHEIGMYDRLKALDLIAKHYQLTTTTRIEIDWQSKAVEDIQAGRLNFQSLVELFDHDLATQLFSRAGVPVQTGKGPTADGD